MSTRNMITVYLRQRMRARLFVPLAFLLALGGQWLVPGIGFQLRAVLIAAVEAFVFVLAFRMWDDVADRRADRVRHPDRITVRSAEIAPFVGLIATLGLTGLGALLVSTDPLRRLVALAMATGLLSVWYAARPSENWNRRAGEYVVLVKYPLIAYAVAPELPAAVLPARTIAILGALYVLVGVYAYVDDPDLRHTFLGDPLS